MSEGTLEGGRTLFFFLERRYEESFRGGRPVGVPERPSNPKIISVSFGRNGFRESVPVRFPTAGGPLHSSVVFLCMRKKLIDRGVERLL